MHWSQISTNIELYNYEYFSQNDVCRLCWNKNADRELSQKLSEISSETSLADLIKSCLQIDVADMHLNNICESCFKEVHRFYYYKTFCQETDAKLKIILQNGFDELEIKDDVEDIDVSYNQIEAPSNSQNISYYVVKSKDIDETNYQIKAIDTNYLNEDLIKNFSSEVVKTENTEDEASDQIYALDNCVNEDIMADFTSNEVKSEDIAGSYDNIEATDNSVDKDFAHKDSENKRNETTKVKIDDIHKRKELFCKICWIVLESKEQLSLHNTELHGIEQDGALFKCFGCEKRFSSEINRSKHERHHCKGLKFGYKCTICEVFLPKRSWYNSHMRDHRNNTLINLPDSFMCIVCKKIFDTNGLLNTHMAEHEKQHPCKICNRSFKGPRNLYQHTQQIHGVKRHECPDCEYKTTRLAHLKMHIRKHTGEKPFTCDRCPKRFTYSTSLSAHMKKHDGIKKYECDTCNKRFGCKQALKEHITVSHLHLKSHHCMYCSATYTRLGGLRRHLAEKHDIKVKCKSVENTDHDLQVHIENSTGVSKIYVLKKID